MLQTVLGPSLSFDASDYDSEITFHFSWQFITKKILMAGKKRDASGEIQFYPSV